MSLFTEGAYDGLDFYFPRGGMNQNISPRILPPQYAYVIENMVSLPVGKGSVRCGTKLLNDTLAVTSNIIEIFSYLKNDGNEQVLLYVNDFSNDATIRNINIIDVFSLSFETDIPASYQKDTQILFIYSGDGFSNQPLKAVIKNVDISGSTVTLSFEGNYLTALIGEITINSISYSVGNIYSYDVVTETLSAPLNDDELSVACVPRSLTIQSTLLIYNGVDKLMAWDGSSLFIVTDYVNEYTANSFNRISDSSFSFLINPQVFQIDKYPINGKINIIVNNIPTSLIISNATLVNNLVTITTTTPTVPPFGGQDRITISYADYPPPFNFLFAAHDRIWALGPGAASIEYRDFEESLKIYWTNQPNSISSWFDEQTKVIGFEDLSDKHGIPDNLEAICSISGYLAFIGRHKTQIWGGTDPTVNATVQNDFHWSYNLSIGIAHGNLLIDLANDTNFVTDQGIMSLSKFNISQQIGATSTDAVDPIVREYLSSIYSSNFLYRSCRSFKYKNGPFCGFKIGNNKILISLYSTNLYSWSFFSGDFQKSNTISSGSINSLYLGINNKLYKYADGKDGDNPIYGDNNGSSLIQYWWTVPIVQKRGVRYANKRYIIDLEHSSSVARNKKNSLSINVVGDLRKTFMLFNNYSVISSGDAFNTIPLLEKSVNPNVPLETDEGMRLGTPSATLVGRLKFVSSSFWLSLSGYTMDGPIYFERIQLFGILERRT